MPTRNDVSFDRRLHVAVPDDLHRAIRAGASRKKLSIADYVRGAVSERLKADGVRHTCLPNLSTEAAR